jgi:pimeloyl-ACP methyl ester carboxylesterase
VLTETDLTLADGRVLHVYDSGAPSNNEDPLVVFWQHGTPNTGAPPGPLLPVAERLGVRWVAHDRPGYGSSTPVPGRDVASAAADVAAVADALGIDRFAVMGHSGGGPHALACAALLPDRVRAVVSMSALAPYGVPGLDWYAGMHPAGAAGLRAAVEGRPALARFMASADFDPEIFTPADHAALEGPWAWVLTVVEQAQASGPGPEIDDELAYVAPWGFDPADVRQPVLVVHGGQDRMVPSSHGEWLAGRCPGAELWLRPADGHVSVLGSAESALGWLVRTAG